MEDSNAVVSRPKAVIGDLPDEVFVLILMLLPFPDQARVRRVSTYWRTAVHYLFGKQEKVRIALMMKAKFEPEVLHWELDLLGFNFESGINVVITHPRISGAHPRYVLTECPDGKQAIIRFISAVDFTIQYLSRIRVAEISWGFKASNSSDHTLGYRRDITKRYREQDCDRMQDVCNRFAMRFQNQLLCFVSPLFDLTPDYHFPVLRHLTIRSVRHDIRNMFRTVTPELVSLLFGAGWIDRDAIHPENFKHLPADFRTFSLLPDERPSPKHIAYELLKWHQLQRCRTAIQSIKCTVFDESHLNMHFPNLRYLRIFVWEWDLQSDNILTVNAAGLQHLIISPTSSFPRLPSHVVFHNLQSLFIGCDGENVLDILSRTSHRLKQLIVNVSQGCLVGPKNFFARLSELSFLTILQFDTCTPIGKRGLIPDLSLEDSVLMLLRGGSRSTLKYFSFDTRKKITIETGAIAAEMRLMQGSESLEFGRVNGQFLTA